MWVFVSEVTVVTSVTGQAQQLLFIDKIEVNTEHRLEEKNDEGVCFVHLCQQEQKEGGKKKEKSTDRSRKADYRNTRGDMMPSGIGSMGT